MDSLITFAIMNCIPLADDVIYMYEYIFVRLITFRAASSSGARSCAGS